MHAAIRARGHATLFDRQVFALLFRILNDAILSAEHTKHVLHRRAQAVEHLRNVKLIAERQLRFLKDDNVGVFHDGFLFSVLTPN